MKTLRDIDLRDRVVGLRADFNVPMQDGVITNDNRIRAMIPTIEYILKSGAKQLILFSHMGRPKAGEFDESLSLAPVAIALVDRLKENIALHREYLDERFWEKVHTPGDFADEKIVLMENTRFLVGEKENNPELAKRLATLMDIFVMDAFATAHRAETTTTGLVLTAKEACAGLLLEEEVKALRKVSDDPKRPLLSVVGGSKVSTKLPILEHLIALSDHMVVGGGIANTFLMAQGHSVGASLCEPDLVNTAKKLIASGKITLPTDVVVAEAFAADAPHRTTSVDDVKAGEMILDFGPKTMEAVGATIKTCQTILLNGPVGVFEMAPFAEGTRLLLADIATSRAFSVAGGGDTVAAIDTFGQTQNINYISTAGGAFLEYIQGLQLPALAALAQRG